MSIPSLQTVESLSSRAAPEASAPSRTSGPRRRGLPRRAAGVALGSLRALLAAIAGAHWAFLVAVVASTLAWSFLRPPATLLMLWRSLTTHETVRPLRYVPLERIPRTVRTMLVRLEDYTFYEHHGIDVQAIKDAARVNRIVGMRLYGGSTITQQLARTLYLTPHKTYFRKYLEAAVALAMDALLGKERILELYFNYAEWGPGVYGIGAAAAYHFRKDLRALTVDEYRRLLTLLSSPRSYGVWDIGRSRILAERYAYLVNTFPTL